MPKLNPYLIKENYKKVEEIREINNEIPSYEEFMKTYEVDEKVNNNYEFEIDSYGDIRINRSYGPGSSQSSYSDNSEQGRAGRHAGKVVVGVASNISSKVAGPAAPIITGVVTSVVGEIGHALSSDSDFKDAWKYTSELGQGMVIGAGTGKLIDTHVAPLFQGSNCGLLREGWDMWQEFQEKSGWDQSMMKFHEFHRANGESYSRYCDVCKS